LYGYGLDLLLIALTGLLSAPHCIGMCGGIISTWTLTSKDSLLKTLFAYNTGRIITYTAVGGFMGFVGSFVEAAGKIVGFQGIANILGGILIILWILKKYTLPLDKLNPMAFPRARKWLGENRKKNDFLSVLSSGLLLGFIPCGLTYTMHMKAASTGSVLDGMLTLFFFGLGTLPALIFVGLFSSFLKKAFRTRILFLANCLAFFIGFISIMRGLVISGWIPSINPWLW
jgi:sulfite exporter TauE/SafE